MIWQCNGKFANEERCHTPVVDTETIQRLFIKAYNLMMQDRVQIIKQCEAWRARLMDFGTMDADIERQLEETQVVAERVKAVVKENASTAQSQEAYLKITKPSSNGMRRRLRNWSGCKAYALPGAKKILDSERGFAMQ